MNRRRRRSTALTAAAVLSCLFLVGGGFGCGPRKLGTPAGPTPKDTKYTAEPRPGEVEEPAPAARLRRPPLAPRKPTPVASDHDLPARRLGLFVTVAKSVLAKGERGALQVRLRNLEDATVSVHRLTEAFLSMELKDHAGRRTACWHAAAPPAIDGSSFADLPPGGLLRLDTSLKSLCPSLATLGPGRYQVRLRYTVPRWYESVPFGLEVWTGVLAAEAFDIDIAGAPAGRGPKMPPHADLRLELRTEAKARVARDPIGVEVRLLNRSGGAIVAGPIDPAGIELSVTSPFGFKHRCRKAKGLPKPPATSFSTIGPGAEIETVVRAGELCAITRPGTYFFRARYRAPDDGARFGYHAWTGELVSEPITVHVASRLPPAPVTVTAHLDRGSLKLGEAATLSVVVENSGDSPVWVPIHDSFFLLRVTEERGGVVPCRGSAPFPAVLPGAMYRKLDPSGKLVRRVRLTTRCSLKSAGTYQVRAVYVVPPRYGAAALRKPAWFTGAVMAPVVTFLVSPSKAPSPKPALELIATPARPLIHRWDPVWISVALRNAGKVPTPVFLMHRAFLSFDLTGPGGSFRCRPVATRPAAAPDSFHRIPAGHALGDRLDLRAVCDSKLRDAGRYSVIARYEVPEGFDGKAFGIHGWKGTLEAKPFVVEIHDPTKPAKKDITLILTGPRTIGASDPIPVRLQLKNSGKAIVEVKPWPAGDLDFAISRPDGSTHRCAPVAGTERTTGLYLLPRKVTGWAGDLRSTCGAGVFAAPGKYVVSARFRPSDKVAKPLVILVKALAKSVAAKGRPLVPTPSTPPGPPRAPKLTLHAGTVGPVRTGDPVELELSLRNAGKGPAELERFHPWHVGFTVTRADGTKVPCRRTEKRPPKATDVLKPGDARVVHVDLLRWCRLGTGGRYRVSPRVTFPKVPGVKEPLWSGVAVASAFWLRVEGEEKVFSLAAPAKTEPPKAAAASRLQLDALPSAEAYGLGRPVKVTVTLRNTGEVDVLVDELVPDHLRVGMVRVATRAATAEMTVPCSGKAPPFGGPRSIIRPGKGHEVRIDVSKLCRITARGVYRVTVRAVIPTPTRPSALSGKVVLFVGEVAADPFAVTITSTPEEAAEIVAAATGKPKASAAPVGARPGRKPGTASAEPVPPKPAATARPAPPSPAATARPAPPKPAATARPAPPRPTASAKPAPPRPTASAKPAPPKPAASAKPAPPKPAATARPVPPKPAASARPMPPAGKGGKQPFRMFAEPMSDTVPMGTPIGVRVKVTPIGETAPVVTRPMRFILRLRSTTDKSVRIVCGGVETTVDKTGRAGDTFIETRPEFKCKPPGPGKYKALVGYRGRKGDPVSWSKSFPITITAE